MIYWFTGQPCSGKTVLANMLKEKYLPHAYRIDGDEMRELSPTNSIILFFWTTKV